MSDAHQSADGQSEWQPCQRGELRRFAVQLRKRRRTVVTGQVVGCIAVGLLCGFVIFVLSGGAERQIAGLTCRSVASMAADYFDDRLDRTMRSQVDHHLADCSACRAHYDRHRRVADPSAFLSPKPVGPTIRDRVTGALLVSQ